MGVLNITPDSFSDGGLYLDPERAAARGLEMIADGADILDLGGESSRPGSDPVPWEEELSRIRPVLDRLRNRTRALISVDTTKYEVARAALNEGADIINDISSFSLDPRLLELASETGAGFILMHMKGTPKTMQVQPSYEDVVREVRTFLEEKIAVAEAYGVSRDALALDPGIGFGKRQEDNLALLNRLDALADLDRPVLLGVSRKSFIGKILNALPGDRLEGTIAASIIGLVRGAHILRVHDVKAVRRAARVADAILAAEPGSPRPGRGESPYAS